MRATPGARADRRAVDLLRIQFAVIQGRHEHFIGPDERICTGSPTCVDWATPPALVPPSPGEPQ